jgi:hypothetical protein
MLADMPSSPRTTIAGVAGFIAYLAAAATHYAGGPSWIPPVAALIGAACHGVGLVLAGDAAASEPVVK